MSGLWRQRLQTLYLSVYQVPWCVPAWGWGEFRLTFRTILTGAVADGEFRQRFTQSMCEYLDRRHGIPVNRARTAITLALRAMAIGPGDDVLMPSYVCHSVLEAVENAGAHPVFADVEDDLHMTPATMRAARTAATKCVIVPHLFGNSAPIDAIEKALEGTGIFLIDDAAQSVGALCDGRRVGSFGHCGVVSCGPGKAIAGPAGGVLVTNDSALASRVGAAPLGPESKVDVTLRMVSFWFWRRFRRFTLPLSMILYRIVGNPSEPAHVECTLSNLDAAIAWEQGRRLAENAARRRANAQRLIPYLTPLGGRIVTDLSLAGVADKLIVVLSESGITMEQAIELLREAGIECQEGYGPCHKETDAAHTSLPVTDSLAGRVLCIPVDVEVRDTERLESALSALQDTANHADHQTA